MNNIAHHVVTHTRWTRPEANIDTARQKSTVKSTYTIISIPSFIVLTDHFVFYWLSFLTKLYWLKYHNEHLLAEERFFIINIGVDKLFETHLLEKVWSGNYCRTLSSRDCRHPEIWLRRTESMQKNAAFTR